MKKSSRLMFVLATAAALTAGGATASYAAPSDTCNGYYEIDGCQYCSHNGSPNASSSFYCDRGYSGYYWSGCSVWVSGTCIGGTFFTSVNA